MNSRVRQSSAGPAGAPARAAEVIVHIAKRHDIPYHLPLGVNAAEASVRLDEHLLADDRKWQEVTRPADFSGPYPPQYPADVPT
jgi:hypothetical protein